VPRNLTTLDGSANFAIDPASEERLSDWMQQVEKGEDSADVFSRAARVQQILGHEPGLGER
jgi:hypothetical protein